VLYVCVRGGGGRGGGLGGEGFSRRGDGEWVTGGKVFVENFLPGNGVGMCCLGGGGGGGGRRCVLVE